MGDNDVVGGVGEAGEKLGQRRFFGQWVVAGGGKDLSI